MHKKLKQLIINSCYVSLLICYSTFVNGQGQCSIHMIDGGNDQGTVSMNDQIGQTFLPCGEGEITSISLNFGIGSQAGTYELYIAPEPGDGVGLPATAVASFTQSATLTSNTIFTFNLTTPFPVVTGTTYRFTVANTGGSFVPLFQNTSDYSGGVATNFNDNYSSTIDLDFQLNMTTVAPIPTMNEWGLLAFGLLVMNLGVYFVRRREVVL